MVKDKQDICTIRIMFPVKSDEQAIDYKKKIGEVLKDEPDAQIHFALVPSTVNGPVR